MRVSIHTVREGQLGAALTLALLGPVASGDPFRRFFFRLGGPANLIDKLVDVRADHAAGEIRIRPGPGLYARLSIALVARVPSLLAGHPRRMRLLGVGVRWLRLLDHAPDRLGRS